MQGKKIRLDSYSMAKNPKQHQTIEYRNRQSVARTFDDVVVPKTAKKPIKSESFKPILARSFPSYSMAGGPSLNNGQGSNFSPISQTTNNNQLFFGINKPNIDIINNIVENDKFKYLLMAIVVVALIGFTVLNGYTYITNKSDSSVAKTQDSTVQTMSFSDSTNPKSYNEVLPNYSLSEYAVSADSPKSFSSDKLGGISRVIQYSTSDTVGLQLPKNLYDLAWYKSSAKPNSSGATVITGHVSGPSKAGPLYNINQLNKDDVLSLTQGDGKTIKYKVAGTEIIPAASLDTAKLLDSFDPYKPGLNIVAPYGDNKNDVTKYDKRYIVYAVKD